MTLCLSLRQPTLRQATKTLLVTDMVVKVEDQVPDIVAEDPRPLLFHARDNAREKVENTEAVRLKGWRRIVQVGLFGHFVRPWVYVDLRF